MTKRSGKKKVPPKTGKKNKTRTSAISKDATSPLGFPVVGIGASAGGLEAFTQLLKHLPVDTGMAFVLVQHLDPDHESSLTQILARTTSIPVREVRNNLLVEANHIYIIPPNTSMAIAKSVLKLLPRVRDRSPPRSIDSFFESLAQELREQAIGIVLSGTASDGTQGLEAIKAEGGITFAQDDSAKYDSMPHSAIAAGIVDFVMPPEDIANELARISKHPYVVSAAVVSAAMVSAAMVSATGQSPAKLNSEDEREGDQLGGPDAPLASGGHGSPPTGSRRAKSEAAAKHESLGTEENSLKNILLLLKNHCGVDFSLYKSSTIQRRVTRRMVLSRQDTFDLYSAFLKGNAKELDALYSDVLISVTSFFRNPEAFEALKSKVFPALLRKREADEPVRVWTLGCSTGQEAYSIAMSFAEYSANITRAPKIQIFATDLNEALLEKARHGLYTKSLEQDISPERLRRFFVEEEGGYRISKMLREQVVFARQNVLSDPPFSRMDLISCRNMLIYIETGLQKKIMPAFHYALRPGGFLFLGASESIGQFTELFESVDKKQKIFSKKSASTPAFRLPLPRERATHSSSKQHPHSIMNKGAMNKGAMHKAAVEKTQNLPEVLRAELNAQREADRVMVNQFAPPGVLVNSEMQVLQFRGPTSGFLEPPTGRASFNVLKMAREGLMLPLRAALNKAKRENKPVRREGVQLQRHGGVRTVNLQVIPLKNLKELCFLILFESPDAAGRAAPSAPPPKQISKKEESRRIKNLERELAEMRDFLQSIQEQNDASNEELQASSEEVQSANEELQSINEELETSKEELESSNEELVTMNEEMANRNTELNRLNADLNNLQISMNTAIVLFSRDLTIRRFTPPAEKIFNLISTDVGRNLGGVRHNLDLPDLDRLLGEVIDTLSLREQQVQDKDGRWYAFRARPYMTLDNKIDGVVLMLVDIDALKRSEQEVIAKSDYALAILRSTRDPLLVLRADMRVNTANEAFYKWCNLKPEQVEGRSIFELARGAWNKPKLRQLLSEVITHNQFFDDFEIVHDFSGLGPRTMLLNARRLNNNNVVADSILLAIDDITSRLESQADLSASEARYRRLFEASRDGILILDSKTGKITEANPFMVEQFNYSREELLGKELFEIGLLKDESESRKAFARLKKDGFLRYENLPLKTKDGKHLEVEVVANLYREDDHTVIQCNIRDITERRHDEEKLLRLTSELTEADHRKDEFLAMLAHELRNPLSTISSGVKLLGRAFSSDEKLRRVNEAMDRQVKQMVRLIDDLLEVSRITTGKIKLNLEPLDIETFISSAVESSRPLIDELKHSLEITLPKEPLFVNGDSVRLTQIIANLLSNAAKYTKQGGSIRLSAEKKENNVIIRVRDTGVGIPKEMLPKVFTLFTQIDSSLDRSQGGLGIGLTIVGRIAEMHDGKVEAFSEGEGKGCEFVVTLPVLPDALQKEDKSKTENKVILPRTVRRVLVVDDSNDAAQMLSMVLIEMGHEVRTAQDGPTALKLVESFTPDVVFLDIGLPGMDGFQVAAKFRDLPLLKNIVIVALTGYGDEKHKEMIQEAGFDYHVVKPIDLDGLESGFEGFFAKPELQVGISS